MTLRARTDETPSPSPTKPPASTQDAGSPKPHAAPASALDTHMWPRDLAIFVASGLVLLGVLAAILAVALSGLSEEQRRRVSFPTSLARAQALGAVLSEYTESHWWHVVGGHACVYIYLQTFAIPGTVFVNLLAGALFGMWIGFPLCLCYNTIGSVFLYWFSQWLGERMVSHFAAEKLAKLRVAIDTHRDSLTVYMIFMRVFPFTPNWFMNVASPHLRIPVLPFSVGVFFGLIPYNFLSCKAGLLLAQLQSKSDIIDTWTTVQLAIIAVLGGASPFLYKRYIKPRLES